MYRLTLTHPPPLGLLLLIGIATIVPGRLHGISGRILRWPILGLTYFLITVELAVYVVIRLFIRAAEAVFAKPKHRLLRKQMATATSFDSWHAIAKKLDHSKGRDKWQLSVKDETSTRYNWSYIKQLIIDLRLGTYEYNYRIGFALVCWSNVMHLQ